MDQKTVSEFANGSERAFEKIFEAYAPKVLRMGRQAFKNEEMAKDLVQDFMIRIWLRRANFNVVKNLNGYMRAIAQNLIRDKTSSLVYRHETSQRFLTVHDEALIIHNDMEHIFTERDLHQMIEHALANSPKRLQEIFKLSRQDGLSQKDIAKKLNLSRQTIDNNVATALKTIRNYIKNHPVSVLLLLSYGYWFT